MLYSKSKKSFYDKNINSKKDIPSDAIAISDELYEELFIGQENGLIISQNDDGLPYLIEPPSMSIFADKAFVYALHAEYNKETITSGAAVFKVDDRTRQAMTEAILFLRDLGENAPNYVDWSAENGEHELTLSDLEAAIIKIGLHRQKGFTARKEVLQSLEIMENVTKEEATTQFNEIVYV